jgi:hypothetical protein
MSSHTIHCTYQHMSGMTPEYIKTRDSFTEAQRITNAWYILHLFYILLTMHLELYQYNNQHSALI